MNIPQHIYDADCETLTKYITISRKIEEIQLLIDKEDGKVGKLIEGLGYSIGEYVPQKDEVYDILDYPCNTQTRFRYLYRNISEFMSDLSKRKLLTNLYQAEEILKQMRESALIIWELREKKEKLIKERDGGQ